LPDLNARTCFKAFDAAEPESPRLRQLELCFGSELALEYANFPLAAGCALQPINAGGISWVE
jgi:hypothetical protein